MESDRKQVDIVRDKQINIPSSEVVTNPDLTIRGPAYTLREADFLILKSKTPSGSLAGLAYLCLGVGICSAIAIVAKGVEALVNKTRLEIDSSGKWAVVISLILFIIFLLLSILLPSEKKELLKKIQKYMDSQPKTVEYRPKDTGSTGDNNAS